VAVDALRRRILVPQRIRVQALEFVRNVGQLEFLEVQLRSLKRVERGSSEVFGPDFLRRERLP